jgi:hypothetical protein
MVAGLWLSNSVFADADLARPSPLTDSQWEMVRQHVDLLDKIAYLPSLLPVIMKHRDTLELSDGQVAAFRQWRQQHYDHMVDLMNEIIQRRIALSRAALEVDTNADQILASQKAIFLLQEELLRTRLSCRELIVGTFSAGQWDSLAFILEEYPRYAGLLSDWKGN